MKLTRVFGFIVFGFIFSLSADAQKSVKKDADQAFTDRRYFEAVDLYKKAYSKEKEKAVKAEILFKIAESYRLKEDGTQALGWYTKAVKSKYENDTALFYMAEIYKSQGKYEDAIVYFDKYKSAVPNDKRADLGVKSCESAQQWKDNPLRVKVNPMPQINSDEFDFSPTFGDKKNEVLYFTSTREGSTGGDASGVTGMSFSDIYETKRDKKGKWSTPVVLDENINSKGSEGSSCLNKKKTMMFFTRCEVKKKGTMGCSIMLAKKTGKTWGVAEAIALADEEKYAVGHPAISADDNTLVFASDIPGGQGGKDLWYVTYDKKAKTWSEPKNLGSEINTPGDEMFPYIRENGELYFSSNGHMGMGGLDIFKAASKGTNQWSGVENLKAPMNSEANDFGIVYEGDKDRGFFTSSREDGRGGDDIWEFYTPPVMFSLEGTVQDLVTDQPITNAKVKLIGTDGSSAEITTDENGYFIFAENGLKRYINTNSSYSLIVSKDDYLVGKGKETTVGLEESVRFSHEYTLQPVTPDAAIKLRSIEYATNSAELQPQYKDSLNFLYNTLVDNPTIVIELRSHTDHRGSGKANQILSQKRAQSCVDYLVTEKGINSARIKAKGMGENEPLKMADGTLLTEKRINTLPSQEEKDAALQRNRRTDFKVLNFDYVPKSTLEN